MSNEQLREALQRIQYKAVSLADAQVIALEALASQTTPPAAPSQEPAVPQDMRMVPASLLEELESSLYEFGQGRCFTSIDLDRYKRLAEVLSATPAAPSQEPVTLTDSYAGVIAWVGDKQCKRVLTEAAIKHEHTPGVAMRNTAHQCVQEVIITAQREKDGK